VEKILNSHAAATNSPPTPSGDPPEHDRGIACPTRAQIRAGPYLENGSGAHGWSPGAGPESLGAMPSRQRDLPKPWRSRSKELEFVAASAPLTTSSLDAPNIHETRSRSLGDLDGHPASQEPLEPAGAGHALDQPRPGFAICRKQERKVPDDARLRRQWSPSAAPWPKSDPD